MWITGSMSRTPDGADGAGSATAAPAPTPPSVPAANTAPQQGASTTPPRQEVGGVDPSIQRAQQQAAENARLWGTLAGHGIKSQDDLLRAIEVSKRFAPLVNDPRARQVLDALNAPPEPPALSEQPLNLQTVRDVFRNEMAAIKQEEDAAMQRQAREHALREELALVDSAMADPRLAKLVGSGGFDDALAGKSGAPARIFANYLNDLIVEATTDRSTGQRKPITDPSTIRRIVDQAIAGMREFRADALLAAAPSAVGSSSASADGTRQAATQVGSQQPMTRQQVAEAERSRAADIFARVMNGQSVQ